MKTILLCLALLPALSYGQQKKDSKIIVTVDDTTNLFNRVALQLYEKGYTLEQKDQAVGFISTNEKKQPKLNASMKIRALIKDSTVTITGLCAIDAELKMFGTVLTRTFEPVSFVGSKKSINGVTWQEMQSIAELFGKNITYSK